MSFNEHLMKLAKNPKGYIKLLKNVLDFKSTFTETFIEQQYLWLLQALKPNTILVDIGAHMGDTAIYFAAGPRVRKIIAYEPTSRLYDMALHNIAMSPFRGKIQMNKIAVGNPNQSTIYDNEKNVHYITLQNVLKNLKNVAIKCDCEGAERYMFDHADLKNVYAMQIEAHNKCGARLKETLEKKGFRVAIARQKNSDCDWLYAKR